MKILRYSCCCLMVAVLLSVSIAYAGGRATGIISHIAEIKSGKTVESSPAIRSNNEKAQWFKNEETYTTITNPCNDCTIKTTLYKQYEDGGTVKYRQVGSVTTQRGNQKSFSRGIESGVYKVSLQRVGATPWTTTVSYRWGIDGN